MNSKSKPSNTSSLLAAIQRKVPSTTPAPDTSTTSVAVAEPQPTRKVRRPAEPLVRSKVGKAVTFWMHDEDRKLVRDLAAWLANQGLRPTDSMVIRAALRMAPTGSSLLEAYRQASQLDGRLKPQSEETRKTA